jgi:hypothetical protein
MDGVNNRGGRIWFFCFVAFSPPVVTMRAVMNFALIGALSVEVCEHYGVVA